MNEKTIVGIDLGTTFSAIAYVNEHGKPEIIPPREGGLYRTTPSVIFFEEDGSPIVGTEARNQTITAPGRTARFFKLEMGNPSYRYNVDGKEYFSEDLSAMILKKLKKDAESFLNVDIVQAVISVPAYFKDAQREATRQAGQIAGLEVIRIINEPTAAALAYGLDKANENKTILVYDFGGGTFDVTIMKVNDGEFTVLATDGDSKLGGKDIDGLIVEYLAEQFQRVHEIDLRLEPHTHQDLWDKAEVIKKNLSFRNSVSETISSNEKTLRIDVDLDSFNELIGDIIRQTEDCVNRVIAAANMEWSMIDTILLSGGSSRIPAVKDMLKRVSNRDIAADLNPDECVALGAAIQASLIEMEKDGSEAPLLQGGADIVVHDVATFSLGVKAISSDHKGYINSIIIPRFSAIPCEKTRTYTTNEDNQERVEIEILQGEAENPYSKEVGFIGKVSMKNLPPHKAGELIIEVTLRYNANGVIEVVAKEHKSGLITREIVMQKAGSLSDEIVKEKQEFLKKTEL